DLANAQIDLRHALDKYKNVKSTKGNKKTIFSIPSYLVSLLSEWKKQQKYELAKFGIMQTSDQLVFTYIDTKGNVNSPLHVDYLNNKMNSVKRRHPK
ncbi:site-specific integrase, partial [Streptococcus pneumoniae]|nr:site-specific integrase [Streptococcus pneumoniae]